MGKRKGAKRPAKALPAPVTMTINDVTVAELSASGSPVRQAWTMPAKPPMVAPGIAMDEAPMVVSAAFDWANATGFSEGLGFLGNAYLAELSQRPEYRRVSEIIASECTRKWIELKGGDPERLKLVEKQLERFRIKEKFREAIELDGFFGRAQIYIDLGQAPNATELSRPLVVSPQKIGIGKVKNFKVIEPLWSYPGQYNTQSPLAEDFYVPQFWYVMADRIHTSRLLTIVGRPLPDMLKPAYAFGGLSMSQILKPYVDNWLRTRQSVSDLVHSFSTMVLATNMETVLQGGSADNLKRRAMIFSKMRDNRGLMAINKATEELTNVSTPLGTLDKLLAQSQEQMASIAGLPLVVLLGVTPAGLNASSDGEIRVHYANILSYLDRTVRDPFQICLEVVQLDLDGTVDEELKFEFVDLYAMDEKDKSLIRKSDADADVAYVTANVVTNEEVRARIVLDPDSPWFGAELSSEAPEAPDDAAQLATLQGDNDDEPEADEVEGPGPRRRQANDAEPAGIKRKRRKRIAKDAAPRPIYVRRDLVNTGELRDWAAAQGLPALKTGLHVTVASSAAPVDPMAMGEAAQFVEVPPGGPRVVQPLGDQGAVLLFNSDYLTMRHEDLIALGTTWDHADYVIHLSLTKEPVDCTAIEPYAGPMYFGPEIFADRKA